MNIRTSCEWTEERIGKLRRLWLAGLPSADVAARLGVTKSAVLGKLRRIGLSGLRGSPIGRAGPKAVHPVASVKPSIFQGADIRVVSDGDFIAPPSKAQMMARRAA